MSAVAIFCRTLKENDDPFSSDYYWQAYQDLLLALKARGINAYLVTDNASYLGEGKFTVGYTIDRKTSLDNIIAVPDITVDVVFDRADFTGEGVTVLNPPYVHKIATNKIEMYRNFPEYQPFSIICNDRAERDEAFEKIVSDMIVVKEPEGYGGKEVSIGARQDVLTHIPDRYPILVQEFLDTSAGFPGYVSGVHDIRLSICGGKFIGCYVRKAKAGALYSNVAQGGEMIFFDVSQIPPELTRAALAIDQQFAAYPRYYSADFIYTKKGWKLLELNALLALLPVSDGEQAEKTLQGLADYFVELCRSKEV